MQLRSFYLPGLFSTLYGGAWNLYGGAWQGATCGICQRVVMVVNQLQWRGGEKPACHSSQEHVKEVRLARFCRDEPHQSWHCVENGR